MHGSFTCQVPVINYMQFHKYPLLQLSQPSKKVGKMVPEYSVALSPVTVVCQWIKNAVTVKTKQPEKNRAWESYFKHCHKNMVSDTNYLCEFIIMVWSH